MIPPPELRCPNPPHELSRLYSARFAETAAYPNRVWAILTERFFARWIRPSDTAPLNGWKSCLVNVLTSYRALWLVMPFAVFALKGRMARVLFGVGLSGVVFASGSVAGVSRSIGFAFPDLVLASRRPRDPEPPQTPGIVPPVPKPMAPPPGPFDVEDSASPP